MRGSLSTPSLMLLLSGLLLLAVGVGSAIAAIPDSGTYSACLTKATGEIRVINYPKVKCAKGERLIRWSKQGPQGPLGPQGPVGPAGIANVTLTRTLAPNLGTELTAASGASPSGVSRADCPAGSGVVGGGYNTSSITGAVVVTQMFAEDADTWYVAAANTSATNQSFRAYAVCLGVQPAGVLSVAKQGVLPASIKRVLKKLR